MIEAQESRRSPFRSCSTKQMYHCLLLLLLLHAIDLLRKQMFRATPWTRRFVILKACVTHTDFYYIDIVFSCLLFGWPRCQKCDTFFFSLASASDFSFFFFFVKDRLWVKIIGNGSTEVRRLDGGDGIYENVNAEMGIKFTSKHWLGCW